MNQFRFDLQRFVNDVTPSASRTLSTTSNQNVSFTIKTSDDDSGTTYSMYLNGSVIISTDSDGTIIFSNISNRIYSLLSSDNTAPAVQLRAGSGTFRPSTNQKVTFGKADVSIASPTFYFTTSGGITNRILVTNTSSGLTATINTTNTSQAFVLGQFKYTSTAAISDLDLTISEDGDYSVSISNSSNATISYGTNFANTLTATTGTMTIKGDSDDNIYITSLNGSDAFTIGSTTYSLSGILLQATYNGGTKYYAHKVTSSTEIPLSALDFSSGELISILTASDGNLVISKDNLDTEMNDETEVAVANSDHTVIYGKLIRDEDTKTVTIESSDEDEPYTSITLQDGYSAILSSSIINVPITVDAATFAVTNTADDYSVPASTITPLSITDTNVTGLSLQSGSILTSLEAQTIAASSYSVYGYTDSSSTPDGITVQRDGTTISVKDIDLGESFSVSTSSGSQGYSMLNVGLLEKSGDSYNLYRSVSDGGSFTLGSSNGELVITPDNGTLEIGTTNNKNSAVFNSADMPQTLYAALEKADDGYFLKTVSGAGDLTDWAQTISLTSSSQTSISFGLANGLTIATNNSKTTFIVTASDDTFVVSSGTATAPTISGATAITLTAGSLTSSAGQTITLNGLSRTVTGEGVGISLSDDTATITAATGKTFNIGSDSFTVNSSSMTVTVTADTMTIAAGAGDSFTVGGETYTVGDLSDGVTFAVDSTGKVTTISDLNTLNDAFNYNNTTGYSVMGAGFLREVSSVPNIWNKEGTTHSLTGGTVSVSDLNSTSNWLGLVIVQDDSITLSPSGTDNGLLIDDAYNKTYGTLLKGDNSYTITKTSDTDVALDNISINSGSSSFTLTVDDVFPNITISAPKADFAVTATNGDYQVTLTNDNMGLVNATAVSLVKGTLTADSLLSGGVLVDSKTFIPGEEVTVMTDSLGGDASIAGLSYGEYFSLNSNSYVFTGSGLRKADQLLRGSKTSSSIDNTLGLDSVTSDSAEWLGMIKASVDGGVSIKSSGNTTGFLVDNYNDTLQPSKLYGELTTVEGGYYLASADNYDAWDSSYTITISNTKASLSSIFAQSSIRGDHAGASFKVDSLTTSGADFTVADATGGVSLSGAKAITQSDGLIAVSASSIQSVVVGSDTIYNSNNLALDVSASGGNAATLSSLDEGENFTINSTGYSIISGLGLRTDDLFFKDSTLSTFNSATLAELTTLTDYNAWIYIAAIKDHILTVPPTIDSSAGQWLVLDNTKSTRYGTLTSVSGGYSLTKSDLDTSWGNDTIQIVNNTLSLSSDFSGKTISGSLSGALFKVSDNASYSVLDATNGASVGGDAKTINQTAGTIILSESTQSIVASEGTISANNGDITVNIDNAQKATVGKLKSGDSFTVSGITYRLLSNGKMQRSSDNALWTGTTLAVDDSGAVTVEQLNTASNWYGAIETDSSGNLTLDTNATLASATSAYVVNPDDNSIIYGTLSKDSSNNYTLSADGASTTLNGIIVTEAISAVSVTSALVNIPITSGSNQFTATSATNGYTINYSATAPSVDNATAITLTTGTLAINSSSQVVTAGTTTVQAVSGEFTVTYNTTDGVTVEGLTTTNESVKIGDNTYTLTAGDGLTVNVNGSTTTVSGLSVGDQFTIDDQTFSYTNAGLTKVQDSTQYVLKTITPSGGSLTLTELLSTNAWLGTRLATGGAVTINQSIISDVIFVDNLTTPTVNYGQVSYENGAYTLASANGSSPTTITVEQGVTATIASEFSSVPVTATQATAINVTKSNGLTYTIGGTISQFVPSTMTFTPATGDTFTVSDGTNSATYLMTAAGLTKTAEDDTATNKIWTTAGITDYVLPDDNAWSNLLNLTNANVLDLSANSPETGSTIIVDSTNTTRWATLTYSASTYLLNSVDGNTPKIKLKDDTTNENYTINFATTVTTGTGTYTINEQSYTGSGLTVAVTADSSTLQDGTVTLDSTTAAVTATNGGSISVTSGTITATAQNGTWYTLNNLTDGDIFKIGTTVYKVYGSSTLAKLNASGDPTEIYTSSISNGILEYSAITGDDYSAIVQLNSNNQLDLTQSITSAIVVGQNDGVIDPTVRIAQITYSDDAYTLSETSGGTIATLAGVLLGSTGTVKSFNTALETTVITSGVDTFTVNGKTFAAQNALTIATESSNGAFLTNGKISLAAGSTVTTRATSDDTITATTGTLTVTADNTANTVTISGLDASDVFSVNGTTYTMTAVGLTTGSKLNYNALKNSGITTTEFDLTDDAWKDILATDSGVLTINSSVGSNVFVANVDSGIKYGTLTKADGAYTLTQSDSNDTALAGVIVDGVKATLPTTCTNTNITAKGATFKVTASEAFTIDASSTLLSMSEVTAVELVEGTLQATNNIPITASGNVITTTSGALTVGIDDTGVFIGELTVGDTFTANGTNYEMTAAGLRDVDNQKLCTDITNNAYYLGATFNRIIEAPSGVLNLSSETQSAEVYDSITSPTTHMGTLTVSNGAFTLSAVNGGISTVTLGSGATLTVTFAATINGSGTTTVNNVTYTGTNLVIDATATSSTLQSGTVTIDSGGSVQATKDSTALAVTSGSITATATNGRFTSIASLDSGDVFTFNGKTYTQTAVGLMSSDNQLNEDVSTAVTVANLSGSAWQDIHQATGGALTINSSTSSAAVVVDITTDRAQSKRYGTLSKSGVTYTLTQADTDSTIASVTISGVKASLPTTCVNTSITANDATFTVTASELFTIDATSTIPALSNVTAITLTSGTIQATNNIPVTVGENVITATSGTMTMGLDSTGIFVGGLNEDETFTVDGVEYKMTTAGLLDVTNQKICAAVTGTYYLGTEFSRIIAAPSGALDLSSETQGAEIYDSLSSPTTHMGTLTVSGGKLTVTEVNGGISAITLAENATLTVNFATTVNGSGNTTVNSVAYNGTDLVIDATSTSSTLQSGTVTINSGGSVKATNDNTALAVTNGSITATAADGYFTNIASLNSGDIFTFNSKTYTQTTLGLMSSDNQLNESVSSSVAITNLSGSAWKDIHQATSGALTISSSASSDAIVADITTDKAQCKRYGTLTKSGDTYTLTQADTDTAIASVTLTGVKVSLPTTCANTTITANDATFTVTADAAFTIDTSSDIPVLSNVTAVNLNSGTIQALNNIPITVGENVITATSGTMTVGIDDTGVFVGGLNEGETFTVGSTSYKMTASGLRDVTNQKILASVTDTYYLGTEFSRIIEAPSGVLNLSNETQNAEIYDSIDSPTTHMASLTVSGGKLTVNAVDGGISTITLAENATLTVDFAATVNGSGSTTVNGVAYNGTSLVIDATATSSTLQSGTVTISNGSVQATNDTTALAATNGTITATAASGKFTTIASLDSSDIFTFNSKTYTQTSLGLLSSDDKLNEEVTTTVNVSDLSGNAWQDITQATNGNLSLTSDALASLVVDITDNKAQCQRYGTLTKSGTTYTLTQADTDSALTSLTISGVKISLPTTCAGTPITANSATFTLTADGAFTVDTTSDIPVLSNVTAITLNSGTIQALNNVPITVGDNEITTTSGTLTVGIDSTGVFVGNLNEGETFTANGVEYQMTASGLRDITNQTIRASVTDTYYLGTSFDRIIEAPSGVLNLTNETQSAEIYDSIDNPTVHMASLTVSGGKLTVNAVNGGISTITLAENATLTVDFAATVNSSGTTTINSVTYTGTDLVIDATSTSSTLQSGTVTITNGSVQATNDTTALAATNGTITATAASGKFTTIASLDSSDIFTFNSKTYTQTSLGLLSSDNKLNEEVTTTVNVADLSGSAWQDITQATNGNLSLTSDALASLIVDITDNKAQCQRYGTLTKSGTTYTLTQADTDSTLTSLTLTGIKISLPTTCAGITITANDATFTVTADGAFTVDTTSDIPVLSNVTAITLQSGTIQALNNVPITIGDNEITTTSGTMTVGIDSTGVFVGNLNEGETFTANGVEYQMTASGLRDITNQTIRASVTDTYYLGTSFDRIIEAPSGVLNLTNETQSAEVYDSIDNPTVHMASLTVSGGKLTLSAVNGGISTITLAENATLTVDFATTVNSSGTTTVNSVIYTGTDLVIDATSTTSTLQSGTVTISSGGSVKATKDATALAVTNGSLTATAADGYFTTVSSLATGDEFTFGSKTYTQTALGLLSSDNQLNDSVTTEVSISDLSGSSWQDITQATNGNLSLTPDAVASLIVDITDDKSQCKRYGTLTKSGDVYTLTQAETDTALTSLTVDGIKINLPTTCANTAITANEATFTVTAGAVFTVDATADIPVLSNVTAITLNSGTIQALNNIPITVGDNVITTTSGTMTVGIDDTGIFVGELNENETFTVNDNSYKMTSAGLLDITNQKIRVAVTDTYYLGTDFSRIIESNGTLDLSNETESAEVYDSISNPAVHMATLEVSGGKLTLTEDEGGINTITLAEAANLTVDFVATVNGSGTTTVNDVTYTSTGNLVINTTADSSTLQSGTVTIANGNSIRATNDTTALAVTNGTITARASNGNFTNITKLNNGDAFTFNDKTYTKTSLGLLSSDNQLNEDVSSSVAVADLSGSSWQDITQATNGALTIDAETLTSLVVDITDNKAQCKRYGTLTKSGGIYTLEQAETDSQLTSLTLDGVKTILPTTCANTAITANNATFTVTAGAVFTVDATADIPVLSNVTAITLNSGTIQALNNIPITVGDNTITTTSGTMTVGVDSTGVFVGNLNADETFTVNGTEYKMTSSGLLDVTNQKIRASVTDTYYLGTDFSRIIESNGTLDLSNETESAEVYDSISNPAVHMATLTVNGLRLTLTEAEGGINTINLAENANLTVDFIATVNSSGTTTVNDKTYAGATNLVIDATENSSTLKSGTITLNSTYSTAQATNDTTALEVTSGSINARAVNGKFTTLTKVNAGDRFSFNGNDYIQSAVGLINDSKISAALATTTLTISDFDSAKWEDFVAPSGGVLTLTDSTVSALVLDSATAPTTKLADLTVSDSRYSLKGTDNSDAIEAVTLPANSNLSVDFATQVYSPAGSVTVNSVAFNAASEVIINSDGETATLYEGTVNLDTTNPTVTPSSDSSVLNVQRGSITATVFDGQFAAIGELDARDSFTFNDTTYTKTAVGLMKDGLLSENLTDTTVEVADLDTATWSKIIVPFNQALDLTSTDSAIVCDDAANPTVKLATFTKADNILTLDGNGDVSDAIKSVDIATGTTLNVDFATEVNVPSGTVTVNSNTYVGTSDLVLQSDGTTSTLTSGTVTLDKGDSVATTNGNNISVSDGDGISVTVGDNVTINGISNGDAFKVDDNSYKVTNSGLINTSGKFWTGADYADGLTVEALNLATNWTGIIVAKDGVLSVDSSTLADDETSKVVDDLKNPTITYGTLTKADGSYALTANSQQLTAIKVDGVAIAIDNNLAGVPLTITTPDGTKTALNVTASAKSSSFTVDATGINPTVADVAAMEISAGKIELFDGQTITLTEDAQGVAVLAGNGTFNVGDETFTIADLADDTLVEFAFDADGNANSVVGFDKNSAVTIDGNTYVAPEDNAVLHYTTEDNWYFDGFAYDDYTVTVDSSGNVLVMPGVKFSDVISSGKVLADDGTIKFAADYNKTPITIINQGKTALNVNDADDNTLAENLSKNKNVTFNADGVETEDLTAVAGATFKLQDNKSLTAGDTKITANDNDCEIGIGEEGTSISADKDATITAPADITLTLNAGDYNVNGVDFTGSGTTAATTTSDGVEIDLATSDAITYDSITLSSAGTATIDNSDGVTVTGGAKVTNADYRALTVDGTAYIDDKTINTAKATEVTTSSGGVRVSRRNVRVSGDTDGYTVNIANLDVIGLENIGNSEGVTVNGLRDATIKTDKAGSLTTGDKTFIYSNDSVTYGLDSGSIVSISDAEQVIGDFSDKVSVNGDGIKLTGSEVVTLIADNGGVTKLELGAAGTYNVNGKIYEIQEDGAFAFGMSGGAVSGVESVENGNLIISQNESGFGVNDATITLANDNPVTLGIVDSNIVSVSGVDGTINGLENATVYGLTNAVINRKPLRISGSDEYDAIVVDGVLTSIGAITDGAIIRSAPSVTVTTAENGTFTFDTTEYKINDTLDGSVDFTTDDNSRVIEINNFAGEISGVLEDVESLNGKKFNISGAGEVSVVSDGTEIVSITGITDGTTVNGDVADMHYVMPEGKVTVNGIAYELQGDDNGALFVSNDGRALNGLDKDATLSVGSAGNYTINGTCFTVDAGDAFTVNRDGVYVIDPNHPPISEKSDADDILNRGKNPVYVRPTATGNQTVDLTGDNDLALIDSAEANVSVQAGAGNDSVVVRHGAAVDVNLDENGSTLIIPTAGQVTLENYNGDNAAVQTFDYSNLTGAIKSNDIKFGDGVMTLGDAIVTYDAAAAETGATEGTLINAHGRELEIGFTHQKGGVLDESTSDDNYLMKGNYAESTSDTQKGGNSTILTGSGNDTILAGAGDYIDAGGGYNQIYLTDKRLRNSVPEGATIVLSDESYNTVSNFAGGFSGDDDQILIKNLGELGFGYGAGDLVMSAGSGQITFEDLTADNHYELKFTDGTNEYKAAIAKHDSVLAVDNSNEAEIFYGNENGISFSEYTGAVEVNLNENAGSLNGAAVQYYGMNKVTGGAGDTSLIGAANTPNTLTAGTGNGSIWSNSGRDLMVGNTDAGKSGTTTFFYMPGDGRDTITNFDFMSGTTDITADKIEFDDASGVTNVFLSGDDVVIGINNSADDYLRLVNARGKSFRVNDDLIAKVDKNVEFDGFSNVYVGTGAPSTLTVGEGMGNVEIWLSDDSLEYHGIWYDGNFAVLDASKSDGSNILAGNENNNLIIGGAGSNSIWGGYASSNDTLVGGSGQNTFFFAVENGHDVIRNAHDGDLVSLEDIYLENIARADITGGGAVIELTDGSRLEVQSSAAIDYRLQDGTTYTADRRTGEWVQK